MFKSALFALAALTAVSYPAAAQSPIQASAAMCGKRAALVTLLKQQFGEEQEDASLQSDQALVELFASEKGTWSILLSAPNGTSCVVAAGNGLASQARS